MKDLPFESGSFDVITHSGGINTFKDIPAALQEWVRVLTPGGFLLITDEGLSPTVRKTRRGVNIVKNNTLFGLTPPLEHLPPQLKDVEVFWWARGTFYAIICQKRSLNELSQLKSNGTERETIQIMINHYLFRR